MEVYGRERRGKKMWERWTLTAFETDRGNPGIYIHRKTKYKGEAPVRVCAQYGLPQKLKLYGCAHA